MQWVGGEKISHLSSKDGTKWPKTSLFAYLCSYKSSIRVTITVTINAYKTIWKNGNKEYNEKYICCFFTIWNVESAITYKCRQVVLSRTPAYFAISKPILLFLCSFHVTCIILSNVYFYIVYSIFPFLFNRSQPKASVVNEMSHLFFEVQKFNFLKMVIFATFFWRWSTLWNWTLKMTTLFRHCLKLFISKLK